MSESTRRTKMYPPIYFLCSVLLMHGLHKFIPITRGLDSTWQRAGFVVLGIALVHVVLIKRMFDRAGTTIKPFEESSELVTAGPFRFSRNPVYLSMVIGLLGLAVVYGTASPVLVIPLFATLIHRRFILPEERMLSATFGEEYAAYKQRVRRWI